MSDCNSLPLSVAGACACNWSVRARTITSPQLSHSISYYYLVLGVRANSRSSSRDSESHTTTKVCVTPPLCALVRCSVVWRCVSLWRYIYIGDCPLCRPHPGFQVGLLRRCRRPHHDQLQLQLHSRVRGLAYLIMTSLLYHHMTSHHHVTSHHHNY